MKALHTADLHLGKVFYEQSLIEDQAHFLGQLTALLADRDYALLVIAGDVYDRSIPSPEAVELFSAFLGNLLAQRRDLEIIIIPGNHDSSARLGFGQELFSRLGIHLVTHWEDAFRPVTIRGTAVFCLPFFSQTDFRSSSKDVPLPERLEEARRAAVAQGARSTMLVSHSFMQGGVESESERIFLGTAERLNPEAFMGFDYLALGHLHRFQPVGRNGWYSGSPLAYSFSEGSYEKVVLSVEIGSDRPEVRPIPVRPLRNLRKLTGPFDYFFSNATDPLLKAAQEDYLEIVLTDSALVENPLPILRRRFPRLLAIDQRTAFLTAFGAGRVDSAAPQQAGGILDARVDGQILGTDFDEFLLDVYGSADPEKSRLFLELLSECSREERDA